MGLIGWILFGGAVLSVLVLLFVLWCCLAIAKRADEAMSQMHLEPRQ